MEKTWKSSSTNLVSMYRNRVQWTRFPYMENEFIELIFHELSSHGFASEQSWSDVFISLNSAHMGLLDRLVQKIVGCICKSCNFLWRKTSSKNSFSIHGKQVHWTRFLYMETEFIELDFHVFSTSVFPKSSPLNLNCYKRN